MNSTNQSPPDPLIDEVRQRRRELYARYGNKLKKLGEAIRIEMAKKKLSQNKLADLADIDARTVKKITDGSAKVSIGMFVRVANALGKYIKLEG